MQTIYCIMDQCVKQCHCKVLFTLIKINIVTRGLILPLSLGHKKVNVPSSALQYYTIMDQCVMQCHCKVLKECKLFTLITAIDGWVTDWVEVIEGVTVWIIHNISSDMLPYSKMFITRSRTIGIRVIRVLLCDLENISMLCMYIIF